MTRLTRVALVLALALGAGPAWAEDLPEIVRRVAPSLVAVRVVGAAKDAAEPEAPPLTERLSRILRGQARERGYEMAPDSGYTGLIVAAEGLIVVSDQVPIGRRGRLLVGLADGREFEARIRARDGNNDLILIEIAARDLPTLKPAGRAPRPGQAVLAVGRGSDPLQPTVTLGQVSALGRDGGGTGDDDDLQITARVNYGNLGGALVDLDGGWLGVPTHAGGRAAVGLNSGVAFAVGVERLNATLPELAAGQDIAPRIARADDPNGPFLGVAFGDTPGEGVPVGQVLAGTAAQRAGLQPGDRILAIDGRAVSRALEVSREIRRRRAGETIRLRLLRGESEGDFEVVLQRRGKS